MSSEGEEVDFCFKMCSKDELASVWPGKCVYVVEEIIHTEQVYVTDLENIVKGYMEPFSHQSCVKNSNMGDLSASIFGNIVDLLYLHRSLLKDMTACSKLPADYGDVFLQHENKFSHYKVYCKNFPKAIQLVQDCMDNYPNIAAVLKQCQKLMNHPLPLQSLLIKPVQRILKYHLLLANINKHLTPNFQGYANLCKAHDVMLKVAADINETQRLYEVSVRMQEIENCLIGWKGQKFATYGNVLLEDYLKVIGFKGLRYVIVFEKLLLLLKKDRKDNVKYHYKGHIVGDEVSVMATPIQNHPFCFKVFSISNRDHYYLLETKNEDEKMKWMATLVSLIETDLSLSANDILIRTSALPPSVELPDQYAVGSRKRPRSSQDEGAPDLKQQPEALSDLSNFVEDIGPAPEVLKRHYASSRKSSSQINQNDDKQHSGIANKPHISDFIPQEASANAKLLEYGTLDYENREGTPVVESSEHHSMQWSDTMKDDDFRVQPVSIGTEHLDQEYHKSGESLLEIQHEAFTSLDFDAKSRFKSSMHRWDNMTNLDKLKDEDGSIDKATEAAAKTEQYRDSVVSASSLESFTIDEHGNLNRQFSDFDKMKSASSSNRSSYVDIDDIVITTDPSMFSIPEETDGHDHQVNDNPDDQVDGNPDDQVDGNPDDQVDNNPEDQVGGNPDDGMDKEAKEIDKSNISCSEGHTMWSVGGDVHKEEPATPPISFKIKGPSPVKSQQSSDTDSEEEHDIDPSIHDSPMYTSLPSSHGNNDDEDVDKKNSDMFVTASGRFIAPTSTLPRMRRSMTLIGNSPHSLDTTPDSPNVSALARKRFRLVAKNFELYKDDEIQEDYTVDDIGMLQYQDVSTTSSLPASTIKRSQSVRATRSQSVVKKSPRRAPKRSSLVERFGDHSGPSSLSSAPVSLKAEEQHNSFAVKNLAPVFERLKNSSSNAPSESNYEPASKSNAEKQSSDATQFMMSMDTVAVDVSNVDDAPSSTPNPFLFTASEAQHSVTSEASATMTPSEGPTTKTLLEENNEKFITPDNQSDIALIQPLSQSPHVPGKTPHAASTMTKSKLFTATTASTTDSPSYNASISKDSSTGISSQSTDSKFSTVDNVASSNTDLSIGQQDVECSIKSTLEPITSDGNDVKENNVDTSASIASGAVRVDNDKDLETTAITIGEIHYESATISDAAYVQLDAANLTKEQSYHSSNVVPSSGVLLAPETAEQQSSSTNPHTLSDDSYSSSFDPLSPLVLSLNKSSVLQQVVDSDTSAQFPVTPDPLPSYTQPAQLSDHLPQATSSVSPSKSPKDFTHLQAPTDKKHSRRKHPNDPYVLSPQAGRLVRSLEYTDTTQCNEGQMQKSPTSISPSSKYSRSLGDVVTPKLKSMSTPSTPATDVSFELPPENVVLQGRVTSFSLNDSNSNEFLGSPDDDDEDDDERGETSPLIGGRHASQPRTRNRQRPQRKVASGHSHNSIEDSQPLLAEDNDEDSGTSKDASSSWYSNLSVRSVIGYLINLGSGIGNLLYYYISEMFRPNPNNNRDTN